MTLVLKYDFLMNEQADQNSSLKKSFAHSGSRLYGVLRLLIPLVVFFGLSTLVVFITGGSKYFSGSDDASSHEILAPSIGGPLDLVNQNGQPISENSYADKYKLIYFGFTYCPVICPTSLTKMVEAYTSLPKNFQTKVQPIFITLDPERDTVPVIKNYVEMFDPHLIGLTGSVAQIEGAKKSYKVFSSKVGEGDNYTIDHSSFIYLQTPDGKTVGLFKTTDTADIIQKRIESVISHQE